MSRLNSQVEVRSCEVIGPHHRNRFMFPSHVAVGAVFVTQLALGLNQWLAALSDKTKVVSLPSVAIEIPGLSLARTNLITTMGDDGSLAIILRFKMLLSGVERASKPELGNEDSVPDYASQMSATVLTDMVLPLLNLCEVAEHDVVNTTLNVDSFVDTLIDRARDV